MKKTFLMAFLVTTCLGSQKPEPVCISQLDSVYLEMAIHDKGVIIDGIVEDEIPREEALDSTSFEFVKNIKFYEIYNTDTTCIIPYLNYVYIVDFFNEFHQGERIRYEDFSLSSGFKPHRKDSDITFEWNRKEYQYYWMEHAYVRISHAKRILNNATIIKPTYTEDYYDDIDDDIEDEVEDDEDEI